MWCRLAVVLACAALSVHALRGTSDRAEWRGTARKSGKIVHFNSSTEHAYFWRNSYGGWEPGTFRVFGRFAPGRVVLDVGAWIGVTALWLGQARAQVVALEPSQAAFSELQANLRANPEILDRVSIVNAALDSQDRLARMSNRGDSTDRLAQLQINVRTVTIGTLRKEHPELEQVGFVKVDTEGYERVLVPALEGFFKEKRPVAYVSLHPGFIGHAQVQAVVDKLNQTFPYLYEADMVTPFNTHRASYTYGDHGGADVVCSWERL